MKWVLIIIAVSINNPADIPARLVLDMESQAQCEAIKSSMKYKIKFDSFKAVASCELRTDK